MNTFMVILLFLLLLALFVRTVYRINQRTETSSNERVLEWSKNLTPEIGDRIIIGLNIYDAKLAQEDELACLMCDAMYAKNTAGTEVDCVKLKCFHIKKLYYKKV